VACRTLTEAGRFCNFDFRCSILSRVRCGNHIRGTLGSIEMLPSRSLKDHNSIYIAQDSLIGSMLVHYVS
jgi:hypothetical protein